MLKMSLIYPPTLYIKYHMKTIHFEGNFMVYNMINQHEHLVFCPLV